MPVTTTTNIDYLIEPLRLHLGDIDAANYRYTDEWLRTALVTAVIALQRWWSGKYLIDALYNCYRNPAYLYFEQSEPPVIQQKDERPIVLMASILVKSGSLEANSWNVGSWRDAEIAVSNIETSRSKEFSLKLDWDELKDYILPPRKRLFRPIRLAIPEDSE